MNTYEITFIERGKKDFKILKARSILDALGEFYETFPFDEILMVKLI